MVRILTLFDLLFDPYAIYGKIFDPFDLLFDKQKCQTVLLTFNNNKTCIINVNNNNVKGKK